MRAIKQSKTLYFVLTAIILLVLFVGTLLCVPSAKSTISAYALSPKATLEMSSDLLIISTVNDDLLYEEADSQKQPDHRYSDGGAYFTYKIKLADNLIANNLFVKVRLDGGNKYLRISKDNSAFTDVSFTGFMREQGNRIDGAQYFDGYNYYFNITNYLSGDKTFFLRFQAKVNAGNGSSVRLLEICNNYNIPAPNGTITMGDKMNMGINIFDDGFIYDKSAEIGATADLSYGDNTIGNITTYGLKISGSAFATYKVIIPAGADIAYMQTYIMGKNHFIEVSNDGGVKYSTLSRLGHTNNDVPGSGAIQGAVYKDAIEGDRNKYYLRLTNFLKQSGDTELLIRYKTYSPDQATQTINLLGLEFWYNRPMDNIVALPENYNVDITTMYAGNDEQQRLQADKSRVPISWGYDMAMGATILNHSETVVYKFDISTTAHSIKLIADVMSAFYLSVSTDGINFVDVGVCDVHYARETSVTSNMGLRQFNITDIVLGSPVMFVRMADATVDGGDGPRLMSLKILTITATNSATISDNKLFEQNKLVNEIAVYDDSLLHKNNGSVMNYTGRSISEKSNFTYKFALPQDATTFFVGFSVVDETKGNSDIKVTVSSDDNKYEAIPINKLDAIRSAYTNSTFGSSYTINLDYMLAKHKTLYVKFSCDDVDEEGNLTVASMYTAYNTAKLSSAGKIYDKVDYNTFLIDSANIEDYLQNAEDVNQNLNVKSQSDASKWFNKNSFGIFKLEYSKDAVQVNLIGNVANTFVISVSTDGKDYTDVIASKNSYFDIAMHDKIALVKQNRVSINVDISQFMNDTQTVYIKVANAVTDMVYGANLYSLGVSSYYGTEIIAPEKKGCGSEIAFNGMVTVAFVTTISLIGVALFIIKRKKMNNN